MPKVSVIVPVYKTEKFLAKCVESILNQTYGDLELLLVDDGSPDRCPQICDEFATRDPRIRVIHKENGGVSSARNAGLDAAKGEYIAFVDSDDHIEPDMYEQMMMKAAEHNCDVVMCDCSKDFEKTVQLYTHKIRPGYYSQQDLRYEYYPNLLMMPDVNYPPTISNCLLLFRRKLLTKGEPLRYAQGIRFSEDLLFGAQLMRRAESFYYMQGRIYYHYMMNEQSATHVFAADKWKDYQQLHRRIVAVFANDTEYDFHHQIDLCLLFFTYNAISDIYTATQLSKMEKKRKILAILRDDVVKDMFVRIHIGKLPISFKLKLISYIYRYQIGISLLIRFLNR